MINYFKSAENTLSHAGKLETALDNLKRRRERILNRNSPKEYPSSQGETNYSSSGLVRDTLHDCIELSEISREIAETEQTIADINRVLTQLDPEDSFLLKEWYIKKTSKDEITAKLGYATVKTLYDKRNRAIGEFAVLYFGAGALSNI